MTEDSDQRSSGIRSAAPYLIVRGAGKAVDFYREAFAATERMRMTDGHGRINHAEMMIGPSLIMLAEEFPDFENIVGPETLGGSSVIIDLEVEDVQAIFDRAVRAGARPVRPVDHPQSGVQSAKVIDPFGHVWLLTRVIAGPGEG